MLWDLRDELRSQGRCEWFPKAPGEERNPGVGVLGKQVPVHPKQRAARSAHSSNVCHAPGAYEALDVCGCILPVQQCDEAVIKDEGDEA